MNIVLNTKNVSMSIDYTDYGCLSIGIGKYKTEIEISKNSEEFSCGISCSKLSDTNNNYIYLINTMTFYNINDFKDKLYQNLDDSIFVEYEDALKELIVLITETLKVFYKEDLLDLISEMFDDTSMHLHWKTDDITNNIRNILLYKRYFKEESCISIAEKFNYDGEKCCAYFSEKARMNKDYTEYLPKYI